jgi:titin
MCALSLFTLSPARATIPAAYQVPVGHPVPAGPAPLDIQNIPKPLPAAPGNLELSYRTDGPSWVWLRWQDNAFNETGFVVERKKGTGDFVEYATVEADRTCFIDEYPPAGTQLCYRVRAVNGLGSSPYSNEACVSTSGWYPAKPGNLTATVTPEGIRLNWTDNDDTEIGYVVMCNTDTSSSTRHVASLPQNSTTCFDTEVTRGETYRYTVRCHNNRVSSANATTDWVTFLPQQAAILENTPPGQAEATEQPPDNGKDGGTNGETPGGQTSGGQTTGSQTPESQTSTSEGQTPGLEIRFQIGLKESIIQDNTGSRSQVMDAAPLIVESRTLLPIRYVTEPLGARVDWDAAAGKATITLGENVIELRVNSNTAKVNGTPKMIDPSNPKVTPLIVPPGRTFVPLRFVSENLGVQVHWDDATQGITIIR